jgi:hypothetical protein
MQIFHPEIQRNLKPKKLRIFFRWGITVCSVSHKYNVWIANLLNLNSLSIEVISPFGFRRTHFVYGEIYHKLKIGFLLFKWRNYDRIYTKFKYTRNGKTNNNKRSKK